MIKGITGGGQFLTVSGSSSFPYVPQNSSNPIQGMIRVNGQDMQVFDGSTWINMASTYSTVSLTGEAESLLQWAREERTKQMKREQLVKNNPALQKALEAIQRAESNFDLLEKFVENDPISEQSETTQSP